jgi:hypothetical protein
VNHSDRRSLVPGTSRGVLNVLASLLVAVSLCASLVGCGHETKKAFSEIEEDSKSDTDAIQKMAKAAWLYKVDKDKTFVASKKANGKYLVVGKTIDTLGMTNLFADAFLRIEMELDAKYMWRFFRGADKRGLDEVVYSYWVTLLGSDQLELYRVRLSKARLDAGVPKWKTADPFDVGEHDLLDTPDAREVEKKIPTIWTIEVNNRDKLQIQ